MSFLNVRVLVGTFNQEKALVRDLSVITNLRVDLRLKLKFLDERVGRVQKGKGAGGLTWSL